VAVGGGLGLEFGDPSTYGDRFGVVCAGCTGWLSGVDELLAVPGANRLIADVEIRRDLGDTLAGRNQVERIAPGLGWVPLGRRGLPAGLLR